MLPNIEDDGVPSATSATFPYDIIIPLDTPKSGLSNNTDYVRIGQVVVEGSGILDLETQTRLNDKIFYFLCVPMLRILSCRGHICS